MCGGAIALCFPPATRAHEQHRHPARVYPTPPTPSTPPPRFVDTAQQLPLVVIGTSTDIVGPCSSAAASLVDTMTHSGMLQVCVQGGVYGGVQGGVYGDVIRGVKKGVCVVVVV